MNFSEAFAFDEQDRLEEEARRNGEDYGAPKASWSKRAKYIIFG